MGRFSRCPLVALDCPAGTVEAVVAATALARLAGLAGLRRPPGAALLIPRCRSIHTACMRFALDVAFLAPAEGDDMLRVVALRERVIPLRLAAAPRRTGSCVAALELPAGAAARLGLDLGALVGVDRGCPLRCPAPGTHAVP